MKKPGNGSELKKLILEKEAENLAEGKLLKVHFRETYESLKPINLIKKTLMDVVSSPEIRTPIVNKVMGLAAGFIAKKAYSGNSHNPIKKLSGFILEMIVAKKVTSNADDIKEIGKIMLVKLLTAGPKGKEK